LVSFYRNGIDVEGASHKQVVDLIKHSADELHLVGEKDDFDYYFIYLRILFLKLSHLLVMKHGVIYIRVVKNQVEVRMIIQKDVHLQLQYQIIVY
jgi:hypothetical protein